MAYCGPKGIPLSQFLDWPEEDQDAALLWQAHEGRRCSGCGTHPDDWNPDKGGARDAYTAEVVICPGCQQVEAARDREKDNAAKSHGAQIRLRGATREEV